MLNKHYSVLLNECLNALNIKEDGIYVDLTLGMGGHSSQILKQIPKGQLIAFDKDAFAIEESCKRLSKINNNFQLIYADFKDIKAKLNDLKITQVDGIIADLGISSPQIDNAQRGFSYNKEARLDMRMDTNQDLDAHYVVNTYSAKQLEDIFNNNAEVKFASRIAKAIVLNRPINSTIELANVIRNSLPAKVVSQKNPCKAIFQAIRIEVNHELESLETMLKDAVDLLKINSSLAIITFHSLEDRIVKKFFGNLTKNKLPTKMPVNEVKNYAVKVIKVSKNELDLNNRSRSAKLRVLTKLQ